MSMVPAAPKISNTHDDPSALDTSGNTFGQSAWIWPFQSDEYDLKKQPSLPQAADDYMSGEGTLGNQYAKTFAGEYTGTGYPSSELDSLVDISFHTTASEKKTVALSPPLSDDDHQERTRTKARSRPAVKSRRKPPSQQPPDQQQRATPHTGRRRFEGQEATTHREKCLNRNRVAASKCRRRKNEWIENLEQKKSTVEALHGELGAQYRDLLRETTILKNRLIHHAGCRDLNIDMWIKNEALDYARRLHHENVGQSPSSDQSTQSNLVGGDMHCPEMDFGDSLVDNNIVDAEGEVLMSDRRVNSMEGY
ncbi:hypothetical protein QQS21_003084 [Conoideocrella luteorostrata]|uniref:BZIP domain-containing protein n=1 Tax=Conoideocrella luteorostrata TaxID=1105319 RepID=A0AAJ0CX11_9HYPO|nr:hypothetical protein QQS21_003084 [Conoideocrella luteorostrata]